MPQEACEVCGKSGKAASKCSMNRTRKDAPIVTLAEWDAASTEQRAAWLKDGHILTPDDAERLRLRGVKDAETGGRCLTCEASPVWNAYKSFGAEVLPSCRRAGHEVMP